MSRVTIHQLLFPLFYFTFACSSVGVKGGAKETGDETDGGTTTDAGASESVTGGDGGHSSTSFGGDGGGESSDEDTSCSSATTNGDSGSTTGGGGEVDNCPIYSDIEGTWSGTYSGNPDDFEGTLTLGADAMPGEVAGIGYFWGNGRNCAVQLIRTSEAGDSYSFEENWFGGSGCPETTNVIYTYGANNDTLEVSQSGGGPIATLARISSTTDDCAAPGTYADITGTWSGSFENGAYLGTATFVREAPEGEIVGIVFYDNLAGLACTATLTRTLVTGDEYRFDEHVFGGVGCVIDYVGIYTYDPPTDTIDVGFITNGAVPTEFGTLERVTMPL